MTAIQSIVPLIWTSESSDAGTDGDVYLGIGGREFYLDTSADDFEAGSGASSTLGVNASISNPTTNDPRKPYKLLTETLDRYPVYLRLEGTDHWKVSIALIWVYSGTSASDMQVTDWFLADLDYDEGQGGLWLGPKSGKWLHLRRGGMREFTGILQSPKVFEVAKRRLPASLLPPAPSKPAPNARV